MPLPEGKRIPDWAKKERLHDLEWIADNLYFLWPLSRASFKKLGRGAIVVDTTSRPAGQGHPFAYISQKGIAGLNDPDAWRMVNVYDPGVELVTMLLKREGRVSTYRIKAPWAGKEQVERELGSPTSTIQPPLEESKDRLEKDAELLQKAQAGELPCPNCGKPLKGVMLDEDIYQGVMLFCEDQGGCGFYEL